MRSIYLIVGFFLVWCLLCAQWYLFWVKGLSPKPENINPHESALAIAEILVMVVVSLFIGFALAWLLRQQVITKQNQDLASLSEERTVYKTSNQDLHERLQKSESILARARETFREDFLTVSRDNEKLKAELEETNQEKDTLAADVNRLHAEIKSLQDQRNKSQSELTQLEQAKQKLTIDNEALVQAKHKSTPEAISLKGKEALDKDDLKIINGIGPGIEKKLNARGIISYRQISELNEDSIKELTSTILFFPGRIERDRWVEQASKLYLDKIRK